MYRSINPYSESQFKTFKYRPEFPGRFGSIEDGRAFCQRFFHWINNPWRCPSRVITQPLGLTRVDSFRADPADQ